MASSHRRFRHVNSCTHHWEINCWKFQQLIQKKWRILGKFLNCWNFQQSATFGLRIGHEPNARQISRQISRQNCQQNICIPPNSSYSDPVNVEVITSIFDSSFWEGSSDCIILCNLTKTSVIKKSSRSSIFNLFLIEVAFWEDSLPKIGYASSNFGKHT